MGKLNYLISISLFLVLAFTHCKKVSNKKVGVKIYAKSAISATHVIEGTDGIINVWGPIRDSATGYFKGVFLHKYDPQLNLINKHEFTNGLQSINAVYNPNTNGWLLYNYGGTPAILYNCDANLKVISQASFKFKNKTSYLLVTDLKFAKNGNILVASSYLPTGNNYSVTTTGISRLTADLNTIWDYKVPSFSTPRGTVSGTQSSRISESEDGNIFVFGNAFLPISSTFSYDIFMGKINKNGQMVFLNSERFSTDNKIVYVGLNQSRLLTITNVSGIYQFNNFDTISGKIVGQNIMGAQLRFEAFMAAFEDRNCTPLNKESFCTPAISTNTNHVKLMVFYSNLRPFQEYNLAIPAFYNIWSMANCINHDNKIIIAISYFSLKSTHDFVLLKTNERGETIE